MKKRALWIIGVTLFVVFCVTVATVLVLHREEALEQAQEEALKEIEEHRGEYDEKSIVLYGTNLARAQKLAEKLGAELRITNDGKFATLTLLDDRTVADVYSDDENREFLKEFSLDYEVRISDLETSVAAKDDVKDKHHGHQPNRPQTTVSDSDFSKQTYFDYLNMSTVWDRTTGSGITVAVIDTGIDTDHPEFAGRISEYSYNATEDKIVKDYTLASGGYDWSLVEDEVGHGTAVSGVIAASKGSGNVIGVAPNVTLLVIKAECNANGTFKRSSDLVFGLYYAIERDVSVVNMSFGTSANIFEEATRLAYDSDVICVAATGNDGSTQLTYPAADPYVFGVGALGEDAWELAVYSNYGENVNLVAPGTTYTSLMGGEYGYQNGTSLAAPTVTGALALYLSQNGYAEFDTVAEVLYASCYDLGDLGNDWYYGYGALDVSALILEEKGTVTFDMLTDELENREQLFVRNHTLQNLPTPERLYAVFDGWYYDPQCTEEFVWYEDKFSSDLTLYAAWANEDDGLPFTYVELEDGTIEIRSYTGHRRFITVPSMIEDKPVSSIGEGAFKGETGLREVILPDTLTRIRRSAFEGCANLVHIEIPDNVTEIAANAFYGDLRLSYVAFGENSQLKSIGTEAFAYCSKLQAFTLPAKLESMDGSAFFGATSMTSFTVAKGNSAFTAKDGVLFNRSGSTLVAYPAGLNGAYVLPASVHYVGNCAFAYARLTTIELNGVQSIGKKAFAYARLESVTLPDTVTALGEEAFYSNVALTSVRLSAGLQKISERAFAYCSTLSAMEIPANVQTIGASAFAGTAALQTVTFVENSRLSSIGNGAFSVSAIREISVPASVISIGDSAFAGSALSSLTFEDGSNLRVIGDGAFGEVPTQTVTFPASLEAIGEKAFMGSALTSVTLPKNLSSLGDGAFAACNALTEIKVEEGNRTFKSLGGVLHSIDESVLLACPAGNARTYYALSASVKRVEDYAFYGCAKIKSYTLPASLEEIGTYAFSRNITLTSLAIPDNVIQIGRCAFAEDMKLASVTFGVNSKLPRIGYGAFAYCGLTSFRVPANVSTMAQEVFVGCTKLTSVTFAANSKLESISAYMFDGRSNLTALKFESGSALTSIQAHGLEGMRKLTSVDFGDAKLTNIDNFAFRFCESLTRFDIPEGVTDLGRYAFYECSALTEVTVPASMEFIGRFAFLGSADCNVYFAADTLPATLAEDWDYGTAGYYLGVIDVKTEGDWKYAHLTNGGIAILDYTGTDTVIDLGALDFGGDIVTVGGKAFAFGTVEQIVLPDTLVTIQNEAFDHCALQSVTIPASVEFIGRSAFAGTPIASLVFEEGSVLSVIEASAFEDTKALASVTLPESLTALGRAAFKNSGISSVTFEEGIGLHEISKEAFAYTKLTDVEIPNGVTVIGDGAFRDTKALASVTFGNAADVMIRANAFYGAGLTSLNIPANVTYIGEYAFVALENLSAFEVEAQNPNYKAVDGLLVSKDGRKLITVPAGLEGALEVPAEIEVLGFGAFEESALTAVTFSEDTNLLTVGCRAFFGADVTEIVIPASVVSIDYYAFAYCEDLTKVTFADGNLLHGIYEGAFFGCKNLSEITLPDTVKEISDFAFYGCASLEHFPVSVSSELLGIYDYAFAHTGLSGDFTTPATLLDIGAYAFQGNRFTSVTIPDANAKDLIIGIGAFEACNEIIEMTVPFIGASFEDPDVTWFGYIFGAGKYTANATYVSVSLKHVYITGDISFIGTGGFYGLSELETIDVPHSVTLLEPYAFGETSTKYELTNTITVVSRYQGRIPIYAINSTHFGIGITGYLELADVITSIDDSSFSGCTFLTGITIPESVSSIEDETFYGCSSLENIKFGNLRSIGRKAFYECHSLQNIVIPESVESIGDYAFYGCRSFTSFTILDNVTYLGYHVVSGCTSLEEVKIGSGVNRLFDGVDFSGCTSLKRFIVSEDNVTYCSKDGILYRRDPLEIFRIPEGISGEIALLDGVTSIDNYDFENLDGLTGVTIPDSVTSIGHSAFRDCDALTSIAIPAGVTVIWDRAFAGCDSLKTVRFAEDGNLEQIGYEAFRDCNALISITIPDSVTLIETYAFLSCDALETLVIGNGVERIGSDAFRGCSVLTSVTLGSNVTYIGQQAFMQCPSLYVLYDNRTLPMESNYSTCLYDNVRMIVDKDGNVTYKNGQESLELVDTADGFRFVKEDEQYKLIAYLGDKETVTLPESAFGNPYTVYKMQGVQNVILSAGTTSIGGSAFEDCSSLTSITIPDSVTSIGISAFEGCSSLTSIAIPDSVTSIGNSAFEGCSSLTSITIPESVTSIGSNVFRGCSSLASIAIPDSVTRIDSCVFYDCTGLTNVTFGENSNLTYIDSSAFYRCSSLTSIIIPEGVTSIGNSAFSGCSALTSVTIPSSVTSIVSGAFSGCKVLRISVATANPAFVSRDGVLYDKDVSAIKYVPYDLEEICIPNTVTNIQSAFEGCEMLKKVTFEENSKLMSIGSSAFYGCSSLASIIIPDSVTRICDRAFYGCKSLTSIVIPGGVTSIDRYAFNGCTSLKSITIPDSVTNIDQYAFYGCTSLTSIVIPEGVTSIEDHAFFGCSSLTSIVIPRGVTSIDRYAFYGCSSLTSIVIPEGVTSIEDCAFCNCSSLTSIVIPEGVTSIGNSAFYNCSSLTSITIPDSVTSIGSSAFSGCSSLISITISDSVTSIGQSAFSGCSNLYLTVSAENPSFTGINGVLYDKDVTYIVHVSYTLEEVCVPNTVTDIASKFQGHSSLKKVTFEEGSQLTSIDSQAFMYCSSLKSIVLPESIQSIGSNAFSSCTDLWLIFNHSALEISIGGDDFGGIAKYAKLIIDEDGNYILSDASENFYEENRFLFVQENGSYKLIAYLGEEETVRLPEKVNGVSYVVESLYGADTVITPLGMSVIDSAFFANNCKNLKNLILADCVTEIGNSAFQGCTDLISITIPSGVTSIGSYAFYQCTALKSITIPDGVTSIGSDAFTLCKALKSITIPDSVTSIGSNAFHQCTALKSITIPDSVTNIDQYAFYGCTSLTSVTIPDSVTSIGSDAFRRCTALKSITIPSSVTSIGIAAFDGCSALTSVTIPSSVTNIGDFAFQNCSSLTGIIIPNSVTSVSRYAFYGCTSLTSITIPESVISIGDSAFLACSSLTSITIPDSVTSIGSSAFTDTAYYNDPTNWEKGMLYIGNHLIKVDESTVYFEVREGTKSVASGATSGCYFLKETAIVSSDLTNLETLVLTELPTQAIYRYFGSGVSSVPITLKNIVLGAGVKMNATAFKDLTGVTIYVTDMKKDTQWDANYPNWNNGNRVVYGGDWSRVRFYDTDGMIVSSTYYQYAQVIRRPALSLPAAEAGYSWNLVGWDLDGDGKADTVPATASGNLDLCPIIQKVQTLYRVIFYAEDGVTELSRVQLPLGALIALPTVDEKIGYTVNGWIGYTDGMTVSGDHTFILDRTHDGDGHEYKAPETVSPTCTERGYDKHVCTICGEWYATDYTDSVEHRITETHVAANCIDNGYVLYSCLLCDYSNTVILYAEGHSYTGKVISHATCETQGVIRYACTVCGDTVEEKLPLASHDYEKHKVGKSWIRLLIEWILDLVFGYEGDEAYCYRCSVCGEYMRTGDKQSSGTASVMGTCIHSLGEWTTLIEGDCENDGVEARICTLCNEVVNARATTDASGHAYPAGKDKCTVCGHFRDGIASLYGYSISLNGNIALNFYIEATEETMADPDAYLLLTMPDGTETKILLSEARTKTGNGVTYYVVNPELPAKDIDSVVTVQIIRGDGRKGIAYERSIREYAEAILANSSAYSSELINLLNQMMFYGDVASKYFAGEISEAQLTEITAQTLSGYAIKKSGTFEGGLSYYGSSVLLESETRIRHYFRLTEGSIGNHTFTVDGTEVVPVREGNTAYWYVDIPNVGSKDLDRVYTVCADGFTLEYSALSYAYAVLDKYSESNVGLSNVARALYVYNLAANDYFN